MKKIILALVVIAYAGSASGDVAITIVDEGRGSARIDYVADANVSSFGLKVTVDCGTIDAISDYHIGESVTGSKGFGIFFGTINVTATTGQIDDYGDPVAPDTDPCAAGTGLGTDTIIIEMATLHEDGNQPYLSGTLCKLTVSETCKMSVVAEPTRGGVVYANSSKATMDLTGATLVDIIDKCATCYGDLTGDGMIRTNDLGMSIHIFTTLGSPFIATPDSPLWNDCAEISGDGVLRNNDLVILLNMLIDAGPPYIIPCP